MGRGKGSVGPKVPQIFLTWDFHFWDARPTSARFGKTGMTESTPRIFGTFEDQIADVTFRKGSKSGATTARFRQRTLIGGFAKDAKNSTLDLELTPPPGVATDVPAGPHLEFRDAKWNRRFEILLRPLTFRLEVDPDGFFIPPPDPGLLPAIVAEDNRKRGLTPHGYLRIDEKVTKKGSRIQDVVVDWKFDAMKRFEVRKFHERKSHAWAKDPATGVNERVDMTYDEFYLVLHVTTGDIIGEQINTFINAKSIHYLVDVDGHVVKMLPEELGAHHAGWQNKAGFRAGYGRYDFGRFTNANRSSIGIEHVQKTDVEWFKGQIDGSVRIVREITNHFGILPCDVVRHRDLAVHKDTWAHGHATNSRKGEGRSKACPGVEIPWQRYQDEGLALAPASVPVDPKTVYRGIFEKVGFIDESLADPADEAVRKQAIEDLQRDLRKIGYWCPLWKGKFRRRLGKTTGTLAFGTWDEATDYAVWLCQERFMTFRGETVKESGRVDADTAVAIRRAAANPPTVLPDLVLPEP